MTFRLRVTLLATLAVAVAVIGVAEIMYLVVQRQLTSQVDAQLSDTAQLVAAVNQPRGGGGIAGRGGPFGPRLTLISGRSDIVAQVVSSTGQVIRGDTPDPVSSIVTSEVKEVAAGKRADWSGDVFVTGTDGKTYHVRVLAVPFANGQSLQLARLMDEIDAALLQTRNTLVGVAAGGIALAALLGALVARAALMPVRRLTSAVEEVTRTRDLSRRVALQGSGRDEIARLGHSFDAMLAALEISLRQQRQLVADASHELRTPLTSLRTNLELLERGHPTDPVERQQVLRDLVAQMERLGTLVGDLIDLARDEEIPFPVEEVRLDEVAASALEDMRLRYPRVTFRADLVPAAVQGVRPRITRAVTNLLDNAAKWSAPGGLVEVKVAAGEVVVRDHGPGIAPEDRSRVFDRFWRASSARQLPGSGLGLSIVKQVAEAHGGSVTLDDPPGGGARFRLRLSPIGAFSSS
ncbi:MAG: HAMP domain-containing histidine kinase [Chloroflexi bacterium]|nr:HAMP domain-containing histidine kinase [Chloroflexota bacterium]